MEACPSFRFNAAHLPCSRPNLCRQWRSSPGVGSQLSQRDSFGVRFENLLRLYASDRNHAYPLDACIDSLRALHRRASSLHATWVRLKINVRSGTKILRSVKRALRNRAGSYLVKGQVQTRGERP